MKKKLMFGTGRYRRLSGLEIISQDTRLSSKQSYIELNQSPDSCFHYEICPIKVCKPDCQSYKYFNRLNKGAIIRNYGFR